MSNASNDTENSVCILILNAGSSSLKAALMSADDGSVLAHAQADWAGRAARYEFTGSDGKDQSSGVPWRGHGEAVRQFLDDLSRSEPEAFCQGEGLTAVGHRVVHGGPFTESMRITPQVREKITALADLAPLHNPPSLETLAAAEAELPDVPHVATFDTAFHSSLSPEAYTYAVPHHWTRDWGIRRYGFHGLSHAYCAGRSAEMLGEPVDELRQVICHLGHGCSAAAVRGGRCIDTTMGFTPLEGLMMATRSGSIDPGILLHVQQKYGLSGEELDRILNRESGLQGVSGVSADMREVLRASHSGDERAGLALAIYTHRVRQAIGALTVTLGGIDVLVFTAGVGEHAALVRESICGGLGCLGVQLDAATNTSCTPDADVATPDSTARILVITTREDVTMYREVIKVVGTGCRSSE